MSSASDVTWASTHGPATMEEIERVEVYLGLTLPADYLGVAVSNSGGYPSRDAFDFEHKKEAVFNRLLSLHPDRENSIVNVYNEIRDRLVDGIVPFADDPFGNYLCFDYRGGEIPTIVYWDHEVAASTPEQAVFYVSSSFSGLLAKLYE